MPSLQPLYFSNYEDRKPAPPLKHDMWVEFVWQTLAVIAVLLGARYLAWRWFYSLNTEALWFSVPVVFAESCAYVGLLLFTYNIWSVRDTPQKPPPFRRKDIIPDASDSSIPISVDVFLPTYNENPELTRYSIRDAKAMTYPYPITVQIYVLDDGNRVAMKKVAEDEGVNYITRTTNIGYKAGNLRNGMAETNGDLIVILDSDTRPFSTLLEHTLGYFRDPDVAWVQTPQWFYDIPNGHALDNCWAKRFGWIGETAARWVQRCIGPVTVGRDPFVSDATLFYDVIQRRRNRLHASFCCGAGSIHRRDAIMEAALKSYSQSINDQVKKFSDFVKSTNERENLETTLTQEFAVSTELTPYKFHVSEDIYTSILLHEDQTRNWKSVYHPKVESKMLSPLDIQSWAMQRFKYAAGSLDILFHDCPLFRRSMRLEKKLMYAATFWSYLAPVWTIIFITAPLLALLTGISPVKSYSVDFFAHLLPFLIMHELAMAFGCWGIDNRQGKMLNIAFFWINLKALWAVLCGRELRFKVTPKERSTQRHLWLVAPQISIVVLTVLALCYAIVCSALIFDTADWSALVVNGFWALLNAYCMTVLIRAALWRPSMEHDLDIDVKNRITKERLI